MFVEDQVNVELVGDLAVEAVEERAELDGSVREGRWMWTRPVATSSAANRSIVRSRL